MFPSELFNKLQIYKSQQASLIEGGVSGQISLGTIRPIDYGKRRFQGDFKANYNPNNDDIVDPKHDVGYRLSGSFIDQYPATSMVPFFMLGAILVPFAMLSIWLLAGEIRPVEPENNST